MLKLKTVNILKNQKKNETDIIIYGAIGSEKDCGDICDIEIKEQLATITGVETINLYINSPGGSVFAALAIGNALKAHGAKIVAHIDGIAASAATLITSVCDVVKMPKNALFMIHNPWSFAVGEQKDLEKEAQILSKTKEAIIETYLNKANVDRDKLSELMDNETWLNAEEAKNYGFIDEIIEDESKMTNMGNMLIVNNMAFDISNFSNFPAKNKPQNLLNIDNIKQNYPDIFEKIKALGVEEERNRIREIDALDTNYIELVENAKYVEITNAKDLAVKILAKKEQDKKQELEDLYNKKPVEIEMVKNPPQDTKMGGILKYMNQKLKGGN